MKELTNIPGLKPEDVVVIRKYSYGGKTKITQAILKNIGKKEIEMFKQAQLVGKEIDESELMTKVPIEVMRILPLVHGILKAPFFNENISDSEKQKVIENDLEDDTGSFLLKEIIAYNKREDQNEEAKK